MKNKQIYILSCFKKEKIDDIYRNIGLLIEDAMTCAIAEQAEKNNGTLTREDIEKTLDFVEDCVNKNLIPVMSSIADNLMESLRKETLKYFDNVTKYQEDGDDGTTVVFPGESKYEKH